MQTNSVTATSILVEGPDKYVISLKTFKSTLKLSIFMQTGQKKRNKQKTCKKIKRKLPNLLTPLIIP